MELEAIHSPNLKTILMVEDAIRSANSSVTREQLKRILPKQVMHQTLNVILAYLARDGKIYDGRKGITWIYNPALDMEERISYESILARKRQLRTDPSRKISRKRSTGGSRTRIRS